MTPRHVLASPPSYYDAPRDPTELLTLLDLTSCATTPWRRLSGGEQQRTLLALALARTASGARARRAHDVRRP